MNKKVLWLALTCLIVLSTVLVSCGQTTTQGTAGTAVTGTNIAPTTTATVKPTATATTTVKTTTATTAGPEMVKDSLGRTVEKPKYGGTFVTAWASAPQNFDDALLHIQYDMTLQFTNEELLTGNWAKGNSGSKEWDFRFNIETPASIKIGQLAESYEVPDNMTVIYKLRKGIKWQNKPPYGTWSGREVTADDIVFCQTRGWLTLTGTSYLAISFPKYVASVKAIDKYTVEFKMTEPKNTPQIVLMASDHLKMFPKDAIEKFGGLGDWRNSIGTGPYMLTDYVAGSSATFDRNPDYWGTDPFHPQNKLPYFDGVQVLVIPDASTRYAAIRTGKVDHLGGNYATIGWEDAASIMKTNPDLKSSQYLATIPAIFYRVNKKELPTYDVRVRQALTMAIDMKAILNGLYQGKGVYWAWPVPPHVGWDKYYIPLEKQSPLIQQIFGYHPDDAKKLLAEAGFASGFNAEILCQRADVDMLAVVKDAWAKINVNLTITAVEPAVWTSTLNAKTHKDMAFNPRISSGGGVQVRELETPNQANYGQVSDPYIDALRAKVQSQYDIFQKIQLVVDEGVKYISEKQFIAPLPAPYYYTFWQPWVKVYSGEDTVGLTNYCNWSFYIWMDKDAKKAATGR